MWKNDSIKVFHGSDTYALSSHTISENRLVKNFNVDLSLCSAFTDFGRGFYVTTSAPQAINWANDRVRKRPMSAKSRAVLLSFELDRDWLSELDTLCFLLPDDDYWSLVEFSRSGNPPHNRVAKAGTPKEKYDVIYSPVSLWPQNLTIAAADQISFHSQDVCNYLPEPKVVAVGTDLFPLLQGTY